MTGLIQDEFALVLDMLDIEGSKGAYDLVFALQQALIAAIQQKAVRYKDNILVVYLDDLIGEPK